MSSGRCGLCGKYGATMQPICADCYLEDYDEFVARFEKLERQIEDLKREIWSLKQAIREVRIRK